jgi:hypothetical protein
LYVFYPVKNKEDYQKLNLHDHNIIIVKTRAGAIIRLQVWGTSAKSAALKERQGEEMQPLAKVWKLAADNTTGRAAPTLCGACVWRQRRQVGGSGKNEGLEMISVG